MGKALSTVLKCVLLYMTWKENRFPRECQEERVDRKGALI
jgi:hypothetical protein